MTNSQPKEVHIHYAGFKENGASFTNEEILALNISFIQWAEAENLILGGGIGPYEEEEHKYQDGCVGEHKAGTCPDWSS